jgi:uncharacterized protein YjbJ (UPF0337 family)
VFDDESLFPRFRVSLERSVGETLDTGLVDDVDHPATEGESDRTDPPPKLDGGIGSRRRSIEADLHAGAAVHPPGEQLCDGGVEHCGTTTDHLLLVEMVVSTRKRKVTTGAHLGIGELTRVTGFAADGRLLPIPGRSMPTARTPA